jgi:hypothetical protein
VCKDWIRKLEKEQNNFRGQVSALRRVLDNDMPIAIAEIDRMAGALEDYLKSGGTRPAGKPRPGPSTETNAGTRPTKETP